MNNGLEFYIEVPTNTDLVKLLKDVSSDWDVTMCLDDYYGCSSYKLYFEHYTISRDRKESNNKNENNN